MLGLYEAMYSEKVKHGLTIIRVIQGEPKLHGCASPLVRTTTHLYKSSKVVLLRYSTSLKNEKKLQKKRIRYTFAHLKEFCNSNIWFTLLTTCFCCIAVTFICGKCVYH